MILLMLIGLFTSRVVLNTLGIEDYGINNVIAGFLSMFAIITGSMSTAIGRFITVALGKGNDDKLKSIFSTAICVQLFLGIIVVVLIESFGIWFVTREMNIPAGRLDAAVWCLHCATITILINLIDVPFQSSIVAHEKMSAFAYMTILDAVLKLAMCYTLYVSPIDKLVTYSLFGVVVSIFVTSIYWGYCSRNFPECRFKLTFDKVQFKEMWGFAGWNFLGASAGILNTQGTNMLMNIFFGVVVNAARGVAVQVNGILNQFVNNFMMALNPQIMKSYAAGDKETAYRLTCRGAKFSFYIMYILALPIMIESKAILELWLKTPPDQSAEFVVWTILSTLTVLLGNTLATLQMAHGDMRHYQIWISVFGFLPFPLTWIVFKFGGGSLTAYYIYTAVYWLLLYIRYLLVHKSTGLPAKIYLVGVVFRCHIVGIISSVIPLLVYFAISPSITRLILVFVTSMIISTVVIYNLGLNYSEKAFIKNKLEILLCRISSK